MSHSYRRRTRLKGERGYVLIMAALVMLPLLAFCGFAVDVGSWYTYANRMQRAADAAALAGVVWMPQDEKAEQVALTTAKANGFDDAASNITVAVTPVGNRRLRVDIHDTDVQMYFSRIYLSTMDIERQSLAEYVQSVPMGSPDNTLGNDPDRWNVSGYARPYYWLNVAAPLSNKANGDRYTAGNCDAYSGCSGSTNLDYSTDGYFYRLSVDTRPSSGNLTIQAFDPAFVQQGNTCTDGNLPTAGSTWTTQASTLVSQGYVPSDAATRYVAGNGQWCLGDQEYGGNTMNTSYIVRAPDNTPFDNLDNPVVCGITFSPRDEGVYSLLNQSDGNKDGAIGLENMRFTSHFRRWVTLCDIPWSSVVIGDYLVQVTATADLSSPPSSLVNYDSAVSTGGYNKFALRAGFGTPGSSGYATGVALFADGRLPIYVNQAAGGTQFYLARIVPEYAGQVLELELFDVADGANASLTVVPPTDMTGGSLAGCTFIRDNAPPDVTTASNCTITGLTNSAYNGRTLTVQIPLPDGYSCDAGSDLGCWFKILLDFGSGSPTDQTTWAARVRGDPVRLVE